jgi:hypothetical protein
MYILQKNNQTFYGPNRWNPSLISAYIEDDFELEMQISSDAPESGTNIGNDIMVYEVIRTDIPEHNTKIKKLNGPFYTIENNEAIQYFEVIDKSIEEVRSELLAIIANERWNKEVSGIAYTIQNQEIKLDTTRGNRDIYLQALQMGVDGSQWKMTAGTGEIVWLILSLVELQEIVNAINTHVQTVFSWEKLKSDEINQAATLEDLAAIVLK